LTWEELILAGINARKQGDQSNWELGDLALEVATVFGEDALGEYAERVGVNLNSLQEYRRVAAAFEMSTRVHILTWSHHRVAAGEEDRAEWLRQAVDHGWSVSQLAEAITTARIRYAEERRESLRRMVQEHANDAFKQGQSPEATMAQLESVFERMREASELSAAEEDEAYGEATRVLSTLWGPSEEEAKTTTVADDEVDQEEDEEDIEVMHELYAAILKLGATNVAPESLAGTFTSQHLAEEVGHALDWLGRLYKTLEL
jgi:hypothetical protein